MGHPTRTLPPREFKSSSPRKFRTSAFGPWQAKTRQGLGFWGLSELGGKPLAPSRVQRMCIVLHFPFLRRLASRSATPRVKALNSLPVIHLLALVAQTAEEEFAGPIWCEKCFFCL